MDTAFYIHYPLDEEPLHWSFLRRENERSSEIIVRKITRIRDAAVGDKLGQKDAEAPDVALDAEPAVVGGLRRGPLDGEPGPDPGLVLVLLDQPRQAKVGDLHDVVVTDQDVSRCEIPKSFVPQE